MPEGIIVHTWARGLNTCVAWMLFPERLVGLNAGGARGVRRRGTWSLLGTLAPSAPQTGHLSTPLIAHSDASNRALSTHARTPRTRRPYPQIRAISDAPRVPNRARAPHPHTPLTATLERQGCSSCSGCRGASVAAARAAHGARPSTKQCSPCVMTCKPAAPRGGAVAQASETVPRAPAATKHGRQNATVWRHGRWRGAGQRGRCVRGARGAGGVARESAACLAGTSPAAGPVTAKRKNLAKLG
jgi:hypothetical protein